MKPTLASLALLVLAGCGDSDYGTIQKKRLLDSFPYVDGGAIAPQTRQVFTVPLFSQADGPVTIYDITTVDLDYPEGGIDPDAGTAFIVRDEDWMAADCGEEGDCRILDGYDDESDDDTLALPVTFAPWVEGEYRAELTIWSNDTETIETAPLPDNPAREEPIWKVQLRALSRPACGRVYPSFIDLGYSRAGSAEFHGEATLENCGIVTLIVSTFVESGTGAGDMEITNTLELSVLAGSKESLDVAWTVPVLTDTDGDGDVDGDDEVSATYTDFSFLGNAEDTLNLSTLSVIANNCEDSALDDWDADGDGWKSCAGDCDDDDPTANPSTVERAGNGSDDDCDGETDETANPVGSDDDGDGYTETAGDCDDADATVSPGATESENGIDDDCDDTIDDATDRYDDDRDGYSERDGDVDDTNRLVFPGASETTDGVDNDGDGIVDEGGPDHDDDQDGYTESDELEDCDDEDPWVAVGAFEFCDGYDNDCDGDVDEGEDNAADGACAFLPRRQDEAVVTKKTGCDAASSVVAPGLAGLALALAATRRRRIQTR